MMNFDDRFADMYCVSCGFVSGDEITRNKHHDWHNGLELEISELKERLHRLYRLEYPPGSMHSWEPNERSDVFARLAREGEHEK